MFEILLTITVALLGGYLAKRIKLPAGALIGGMLATAALGILTGSASLPVNTRLTLQILTGVMLGCSITLADLHIFRQMIKPILLLIVGLIALNVSIGLLIHRFSPLSLSTALFASAPGGVSDMALIADEMGADTSMVSFLQLFRLFFIYAVFPPVIRRMGGNTHPVLPPMDPSADSQEITINKPKRHAADLILTLAAGLVGGLLIEISGIPAGGLIGSLAGCAVWQISTGRGTVPGGLRFFVQAGAGGLIGSKISMDSVRAFPSLLVPFLLMAVSLVLFTLLFGFVMSRVSGFDLPTSMLCISPGGIVEMSLMADEFHCSPAKVLTMHTVRILVVVGILPTVIKLLI